MILLFLLLHRIKSKLTLSDLFSSVTGLKKRMKEYDSIILLIWIFQEMETRITLISQRCDKLYLDSKINQLQKNSIILLFLLFFKIKNFTNCHRLSAELGNHDENEKVVLFVFFVYFKELNMYSFDFSDM